MEKVALVSEWWSKPQDVTDLQKHIKEVRASIADPKNKWALSYLNLQLQAFEAMEKLPLQIPEL